MHNDEPSSHSESEPRDLDPTSHADLKAELPTVAVDEPETSSALRGFLGLFVVPLLVVLASVGVFLGFGWLAYDGSEVGDFVNDLSHGWKPRRTQAAYELSKILLADPQALTGDPAAQSKVRNLFTESDDEAIRRYLALVLGYTGDREAVPALVDAAEGEDPQLRIYALWALGVMGDLRGEQQLIAALNDTDPGVRKIAAHALGEIRTPAATEALVAALGDGTADVRWNAAATLAVQGSDAGLRVLLEMVDRDQVGRTPEIGVDQVEDVLLAGIEGLARVGGSEAKAAIQTLAEDPSLRVRDAARAAAKSLDSF